ncbi:MAG TPA: outer membrane beta-barrel protein [Acidobacteriaceae bacterium]|nr:outer membrane beta-barrel protein [Acidobacteriaceae bacterium]
MSTSSLLFPVLRRSLLLAVFTGAGFAVAGAQTTSGIPGAETAPAVQPSAAQPLNFQTAAVPSFSSSLEASSSSSSSDTYNPDQAAQNQLASVQNAVLLPDLHAQYGQRRRYGAPRYRGGNTNPDGSEKYTAYVGGGFTAPVGDLHNYDTTSWGFQVGAGRNFNKNFGVNLEFAWDEFGIQGNVLNNQGIIEDPFDTYSLQGNTDGYSHIWSFSVQPVYNIKSGEGLGAYVTGGAGFYHKITTFTTPETGCDPYYAEIYGICIAVSSNEPYDSYTSNAPGIDGGFGLTYKISRFANERLYAEVRYVHVFNQQKPGVDASNFAGYINNTTGAINYPTSNLYPANSRSSDYLPVKFGIRF